MRLGGCTVARTRECTRGRPLALWQSLFEACSPTKVEEQLQHVGIQVDKGTVRRYVELFGENFPEQHGITAAGESLAQKVLAALFEVETVDELKEDTQTTWSASERGENHANTQRVS